MAVTKVPEDTPEWSIVTYYPDWARIDPVTGLSNADPIGYGFVKPDMTISERFETLTEMYEARNRAMIGNFYG